MFIQALSESLRSTILLCVVCAHIAFERFVPQQHLTRDSVRFLPSFDNATHVQLTLPASKTDPFRKGVTILLSAAPGQITCPVAALKHLFTVNPQPATSPLFADASGSALTRDRFITTLKLRLAGLGFDSSKYSGHSFRRGAATSSHSCYLKESVT